MTEVEALTLRIEAAKALGDILIPVVLAAGGALLYRQKAAIDAKADINREAVARRGLRLEPLCAIANDIYCFTLLVGHYRSITPLVAVERKRQFESQIFATLTMWDDESLTAAMEFIEACYVTKQGRATSARLASDMDRQKEERADEWDDEWTGLFLEGTQRDAWIVDQFGEISSYRNEIVKPRYAALLVAMSRTTGGMLSKKTAIKMLSVG